ncbi:MAG TPA: PQQ-binding-like beta-propeller repeat protein [Phycisphaerae bacterium]|nr:PQQ-binding-like beta-propeller repeat protein [Phycisphaerae bacterium]
MTEDELIELIQGRLPEELTARQVAELRRAMRTSSRLRDALLDELSLEQGLATKYAPAADRVEEIVADIARRAAAMRRSRWRLLNFGLLLLMAAVVAGVLLLAHLYGRPPETDGLGARTDGKPAPGASTRPAATEPAAPATQEAAPAIAAVTGAAPTSAPSVRPKPTLPTVSAPPTAPTALPAGDSPAAAVPLPPWRMYDFGPRLGGRMLREQLRGLFKEVSNTYARPQQKYVEIRGRYALQGELTDKHLLRLAAYDVKQLSLEVWSGAKGVRFARGNDSLMAGYLLERKGRDVLAHLAAVDARWRYFSGGALDLRWQDGNAVLARADVPLLVLPLEGEPRDVQMEADAKFVAARLLPCEPIRLPAAGPDKVLVDSAHTAALTWKPEGDGEGVELRKGADGSLEIAGKPREERTVWTTFTPAVGRRVELQLRDVAHRTGFVWRLQGGRRHIKYYVVEHRGAFVLTTDPDNSRSREEAFDRGLVVGETFWVRLGLGLDCCNLDFSADGRHWGPLHTEKLESHSRVDEPLQFGIFLYRDRDGRAKVTRLRVRQAECFAGLADPALVQRVPDTKEIREASSIEKLWPIVVEAKPDDAAALDWRLACDAALIQRSGFPAIRLACAIDLLETAGKASDRTGALLAAASDLAAWSYTRDNQGPAWKAALGFYEALAQRCFVTGRRDELVRIGDHWLGDFLGRFQYQWDLKDPMPPGLVRLMVYHLMAKEDWRALACESGRLLALYVSGQGDLPRQWEGGTEETRLLQWAQAEARSYVDGGGDDASGAWSGAWTHPLTVPLDRETLNVIAEFVASVNAKAYEHAAKVLASQLLPDGIVPTDSDGRLYQAIHFHIRQLLQTHPELARELRERFAPIGGVRLQRALRDGDVETLQSLVVQFHGTEPARQALYRLADRDLSMGNVVGAAAKYGTLLESAPADQQPELAAKFRLASALAGQLAGRPVTQPVDLPGKRMSPGEFEAMISSLVESRRTGGVRGLAVVEEPPAPAPGDCEAAELMTLSADRDDSARPFTRNVAWATRGRDLIVHQRGRVSAVNLDTRKTLWSHSETLKSSPERYGPSWPVLSGDRLFVRMDSRRETLLACLDLKIGQPLWQQRFDEGILSDPILVNSWLYVLTYRTSLGGLVEIYLRRISPETGQSAMASRLVALRRDSRLLVAPGRLTLAGEALVFRCSATLVCCDLLGEVRWIRRLTFVPPDIDRALTYDMVPGEMIVRDGRVIFGGKTCPSVTCVELKSGREVWSYLQPDLRRVVGLVGGKVVLATEGHLEALDADTGKPAWRVERTAEVEAVLPAEKDTIACVTLDRVDPKNRKRYGRDVRRVCWLSAADGSIVRSVDIEDAALYDTLYGAERIYSTGKELIVLAGFDAKPRSARLFRLRIK